MYPHPDDVDRERQLQKQKAENAETRLRHDIKHGFLDTDPSFEGVSVDVLLVLQELDRLRQGNLTNSEFQTLCHNLYEKKINPPCTRAEFEQGCTQFQDQLFGPKAEGAQNQHVAKSPTDGPVKPPTIDPVTKEVLDGKFEPCCECGEDYPRADLILDSEIFCPKCRVIENERLHKNRCYRNNDRDARMVNRPPT